MEFSTMTNWQKFVNALYDKYGMSIMYENVYDALVNYKVEITD